MFSVRHLWQHLDTFPSWIASRPTLNLSVASEDTPVRCVTCASRCQPRCGLIAFGLRRTVGFFSKTLVSSLLLAVVLGIVWLASYLASWSTLEDGRHWFWAVWTLLAAVLAFVHVLFTPALWMLVNAVRAVPIGFPGSAQPCSRLHGFLQVLRHDIATFARTRLTAETIQSGAGFAELQSLAADMHAISASWTTYLVPSVFCTVLGMFFAIVCAASEATNSTHWVVVAVTESAVLLVVLMSAGLTTSAYGHEPQRAAYALVREGGETDASLQLAIQNFITCANAVLL